jgi:hypothetical protein
MSPSGNIHTQMPPAQTSADKSSRIGVKEPDRGSLSEREWGMSRETLAIVRAVLGLAQGAALYLLYNAVDAKIWPATDGLVFAPLALTAVFLPLVAVAGAGNLRLRTFAIWIVAAAVIVPALGFYDLYRDPSGGVFDSLITARTPGPRLVPDAPLWLVTAAGLAIAHTLIVSGDADLAFIPKYTRYFDIAWKHAVQAALAGAFVGALWILLVIGAALFNVIGIEFFRELLLKPWFFIPVTTLAAAVALHITDVHAGLVRGVRTLALTLLSWLLPLFALIAAGFLGTLLFTGLEPLWRTHYATYLVLVTAAALIVLVNAAYLDGARERRIAVVLRGGATAAALALTPLVAIAAYAVMLRVNQYGWTPERVIATACVVIAGCYAVGYGLAAIASQPWLHWIEMTNVATAVVILAAILALFSPAADPARLAVADQVARLEAGRTPVDQFDFVFLRFHSGRYGIAALERLRQKQDGPDAAAIAEKAAAALAGKNEHDTRPAAKPPTPEERAANIIVAWPQGQPLPAAFLQQDWNASPEPWRHAYCLTNHVKCDAVMLDLDGDGAAEILLAGPEKALFSVYKETGGRWILLGELQNSSCPGVRDALRAGQFELAAPAFTEIKAAGATLQLQLINRGCP